MDTADAVRRSDIVFITVGTPALSGAADPDWTAIEQALRHSDLPFRV